MSLRLSCLSCSYAKNFTIYYGKMTKNVVQYFLLK
jgi:hypothetical protein